MAIASERNKAEESFIMLRLVSRGKRWLATNNPSIEILDSEFDVEPRVKIVLLQLEVLYLSHEHEQTEEQTMRIGKHSTYFKLERR